MRKLGFKDIFTVSRILKKMKLQVEFAKGMTEEQMGTKFILAFVESIGEAEEEVTGFLADLKGLNDKQIKDLDLNQTFDLIMEFKEIPDLQDFFTRVSKLMK